MLATAAVRTKSPEAFRTISEVAVELDLPQHVLRFWEGRFAQVKPVKRAGGRRYYRPEDIDLLRGIRALLYHDGFTIKGVQKILRDKGVRYVADLGRNVAGDVPVPIMRLVEARRAEPSNVIAWERLAEAVAEELPPRPEEPAEWTDNAVAEPSGTIAMPAAFEVPPLSPGLCEVERVKLEILLAELLQLKARLQAVARQHA